MKQAHRSIRVACSVAMVSGLLGLALLRPAAAAEKRATTTTASGWEFVDMVRVGRDGFTGFNSWVSQAGPNGELVFIGGRDGRNRLFRLKDGALTELTAYQFNDLGFIVLPSGDILFERGEEQSGNYYEKLYRWSDRPISTTLVSSILASNSYVSRMPAREYLRQATSDNRWLSAIRVAIVDQLVRWDVGLTDGVNVVPMAPPLEYGYFCPGFDLVRPWSAQGLAAARNLIAYIREATPCGGTVFQWTIELVDLVGGGTQVVGSGQVVDSINPKGTRPSGLGLFVNDQGQVATVLWNQKGSPFRDFTEIMIFDGGSGRIVATPTVGNWNGLEHFELRDFDQDGHVLFMARSETSAKYAIYLDSERVIGTGDTLFGKTITQIDVRPRAAAPGQNAIGAFALEYTLADGTVGIAIARRAPRWSNPNGGAWGAGANWSTSAVPGADANVEFDLDAAYGVDLGVHTASEAWVRRGDVEFRSGSLTLTGTTNSHLEVSGPPTDPAKLTISGVGTQVTATVFVGFNGAGELNVQDAIVWQNPGAAQGLDASVGFGGPATVTVSGGGAGWMWDQLELGVNERSLLQVKDGALVGFIAQRAIIGGSTLAFPVKNETARLVVDDAANTGMTGFGLVHDLRIGEGLIGEVSVLHGGNVSAVTTTLGTRDHGAATDGWLTVDGLSTQRPSTFESVGYEGGGLYASTGAGTSSVVQVSGGGVMTVGKLTLAQAAGSSAFMTIDGTAAGRRSTAAATDLVTDTLEGGECVVGERGRATLQVTNGALLRCRRLAVGVYSGSRGAVEVDRFEGDFAEIAVADPGGDAVLGPLLGYGAICIGSAPLCDFSISSPRANVQGDMLVGADAYVTARVVVVGAGGVLRGRGIVSTGDGVIVTNGGRVSPGVIQLANPRGMRTLTETVGTLTIRGDLTVSETGVITLDVLGATPALRDRLVVTGTMNTRGQMVVNFGNGYAPKAGDKLQLIEAGVLSDAGASVVVAGLADGFQYDVSAAGGGLVLTALSDGAPAGSAPAGGKVYVPLAER